MLCGCGLYFFNGCVYVLRSLCFQQLFTCVIAVNRINTKVHRTSLFLSAGSSRIRRSEWPVGGTVSEGDGAPFLPWPSFRLRGAGPCARRPVVHLMLLHVSEPGCPLSRWRRQQEAAPRAGGGLACHPWCLGSDPGRRSCVVLWPAPPPPLGLEALSTPGHCPESALGAGPGGWVSAPGSFPGPS